MKRKHRHSSTPPNAARPEKQSAGVAPKHVGKAAVREENEPTSNLAPTPLWLIFLFGLLFYLGMLYVDHAGGGFDQHVYEPFRDYEDTNDHQPKSDNDVNMKNGGKTYSIQCSPCHGPSGAGDPSRFIPPLTESEWVLAEKPGRLIRIVSKGLTGPLEVKGKQFGGGVMQAVGDQMMGTELERSQQIADVLLFVRNSFGNKASPVTVQEVKAVREKIKDRTDAWTAEELKNIREDE